MSGPSITNPANATPVWEAAPPVTAVFSGQRTTTAAAVVLPTQAASSRIILTAPSTNVAAVDLGPAGVTTGTGYQLLPGQSVTLPLPNLNLLYLVGANTSDKITWIGF